MFDIVYDFLGWGHRSKATTKFSEWYKTLRFLHHAATATGKEKIAVKNNLEPNGFTAMSADVHSQAIITS